MSYAPRTGMSSSFGVICHGHFRADGTPHWYSAFVPAPQHIECDFWLCTCAGVADNEDHFFGPLEKA